MDSNAPLITTVLFWNQSPVGGKKECYLVILTSFSISITSIFVSPDWFSSHSRFGGIWVSQHQTLWRTPFVTNQRTVKALKATKCHNLIGNKILTTDDLSKNRKIFAPDIVTVVYFSLHINHWDCRSINRQR